MLQSIWVQLINDLRNGDDLDRVAEAYETISKIADESHIAVLYALLQDASSVVREAAAVPLARLEGIRALPAFFQALTRGFQEGLDNDGLSASVADLLEAHKATAAPVLLDLLAVGDGETRANAAWALGHVEPEITAGPLIAALSDADADVRSAAAGSLASFRNDPRVIEALLNALHDSNEQVRISVASALGYLGDQSSIGPLKTMLKKSRGQFRRIVKDALEQLGSS